MINNNLEGSNEEFSLRNNHIYTGSSTSSSSSFIFIATIWNCNSNNIQEANHMEWKQWEDL